MASIRRQIAAALEREFIEGTVFRVDLDRVDVAPAGSTGILRSLPLTGDREKVKPGDPVRVIRVAGERLALVGDVAVSDEVGDVGEDASEITLAERLSTVQTGQAGGSGAAALSDLADVDLSVPPAEGELLGWDSAVAKWTPVSAPSGGDADSLQGYLPDQSPTASAHVPVTDASGCLNVAGIRWASMDQPVSFSFIIDGGGSAITTGYKGVVHIPYSMAVSRVAFYGDVTGSASVQILKFNSHAGFPGSDYTNFGDHVMTSAQKTEWTGLNYVLNAGNLVRFWVQSASAIKNLSIHLSGLRL